VPVVMSFVIYKVLLLNSADSAEVG
jgi:hypothetical protein